MQQLLFWFLQIIYAVNEVTAMLQDESNFVSANIYSQPPQNGNDTDEDSGSEDSGVTVDNLTGRQLRAEASATIFTSDRFSIFFSVRFFNKFAVKWLLKIPPHLAYFATLPSDGSVATCLRCGGVVNNQIKKGLLLSLPVKKIILVNIWQCYKQEGGCLMHFVRQATRLLKDEKSARDSHTLACNFAELHH